MLYTDQADMETGMANKGDAGLHVQFYDREVIDPIAPEIGRHEAVKRTVPFCKIVIPGDKNFIWDQPVRQEDKERFPRHWLAYTMNREPEGQIFGTPLKQWNTDDPTGLTENQLIELQAMRFQTVEQIARANDMQLQRMGMGAEGLKVKAQAYLEGKNRQTHNKELHETKKALAELQAQMAELLNAKASGGLIDTPSQLEVHGRAAEDQAREAIKQTLGVPMAATAEYLGKPDGRRKPMSEERKQALRDQLAKAREAKKGNAGGQQHASPVGAASHG